MKTRLSKLLENRPPGLSWVYHLRFLRVHLSLVSLILLGMTFSAPARAVEDGQVLYIGGTTPGFKEGALGRLDTTSPTELVFEAGSSKLAISYTRVLSYEYTQPVAHHLGVLPAIGVGLLVHRRHRHFIRITFQPENSAPQIAIFEVSKQIPLSLMPILQARVPHPEGCKPVRHCANAKPIIPEPDAGRDPA